MEAKNDRVAEKDYLDLLNILAKVGEEEDNQLFQWVRPIYLDDEVGNPNPWIVTHAREFGVDVERVLSEEVHNESFTKDTEDSFQRALDSHQKVDSTSVGQSSRPSTASTFASGYDGSRGGTELMMEVITQEEILGNANKVNIQWVNSPVKMISHTTHKMKIMALE